VWATRREHRAPCSAQREAWMPCQQAGGFSVSSGHLLSALDRDVDVGSRLLQQSIDAKRHIMEAMRDSRRRVR
jgi:hypothetical protein